MLALRKTGGVVGDDVELQDVTGNGRATDAVDWQEGDLLAVGTSPAGGVAQVLGSREAGERKGPKFRRARAFHVCPRDDQYFAVPRSTAICEPEIVADPSLANHATTSETSSGVMNSCSPFFPV
jgi:hypothetical protein